MPALSLDDIRQSAEAKYGSIDITLPDGSVVVLLNPLRLSKQKRSKLTEIQKRLNEAKDNADEEALLEDAIRVVAKHPSQASALLEEVNGDLAVLVEVFAKYTEGVQAGEALASHG